MFQKKHYIILAELIGKSLDLTEFTEKLIETLKNDREAFNEWRFREYVQKIRRSDTAYRMKLE